VAESFFSTLVDELGAEIDGQPLQAGRGLDVAGHVITAVRGSMKPRFFL